MLYDDQVQLLFDQHLNSQYESIEGILPSDILLTMNSKLYYRLLAEYISDNFIKIDDEHYIGANHEHD